MSNPIDVVARHLAEQFSCGSMSVHVDDELADGRPLKQVMSAAMKLPRSSENEAVLDAFGCIADVWGSGYDMASGDDFVLGDDTVADLVDRHLAAIAQTRVPTI